MAWLKRLSAPIAKERKSRGKFIVCPRGPHKKAASLPLLVALRDKIMLVGSLKEGKGAIKRGEMLIDCKVCRDEKFGAGLFDTVSVPSASAFYRIVPEKAGGLKLLKISEKESKIKICKIIGKTSVSGGKIQYNLHDGRNLISGEKYNAGDSLIIGLPGQKVIEHLKFEKENTGFITTGKNAGMVAKLEKIEAGRTRRVWMKKEGGIGTAGSAFEAPMNYVIIIGKEKPAIAVSE